MSTIGKILARASKRKTRNKPENTKRTHVGFMRQSIIQIAMHILAYVSIKDKHFQK